MNQIRVGVNLLTCSLVQCPLHATATEYAARSLLDSDLQQFDWQMQVVDNGSTCERTVRFLQELEAREARVAVEWPEGNLGIARGRNLGYRLLRVRHAPHFLVEIHSDHVFPPVWLAPIVGEMAGTRFPRAAAIGSALLTSRAWAIAPLALDYSQSYEQCREGVARLARAVRRPGHVREGLTHPVVLRADTVEGLGMRQDGVLCVYDANLPGLTNFEDTELAYRLHRAGWQWLIHHGSVVYHHYFLSRLDVRPIPGAGGSDHDENSLYCQRKHGPEFITFATQTVGQWMERAYR